MDSSTPNANPYNYHPVPHFGENSGSYNSQNIYSQAPAQVPPNYYNPYGGYA